MKDGDGAFAAYMDRTWVNWRRELNGVMCERVRLAFLAGAEAQQMESRKCEERPNVHAEASTAKTGTSNRKPPSKASRSRKSKHVTKKDTKP